MTQPIHKIIEFYNEQLLQLSLPFENKIAELNDQIADIQKEFPDEITDVLKGIPALEVVKREDEALHIEMATILLNKCIDRVALSMEKARQPLENRLAYIIGAYKQCLQIKENIIKLHPAPQMFVDSFNSQYAALIDLLHDCPQSSIDELNEEINHMSLPQNFSQLVA
jgi:hypothetical protein